MSKSAAETKAIKRNYLWALALIVLGLVLSSAAWLWSQSQPVLPGQSLMELSPVTIEGPTDLCPGDTLTYDQTLIVNAPGVFDMDVIVWKITPPSTVVYSISQRMVFNEPIEFPLGRSWTVPGTYTDLESGENLVWEPGEYKRIHSIISPGRLTKPSIELIEFNIKEGCEVN